MRKLTLLALLALAGCTSTGALTPDAQAKLAAICAKDATLQPLVAQDVATLAAMGVVIPAPQAQMAVGGTMTVLTVDNAVVHPAVIAACAQLTAPAAAPVAAK